MGSFVTTDYIVGSEIEATLKGFPCSQRNNLAARVATHTQEALVPFCDPRDTGDIVPPSAPESTIWAAPSTSLPKIVISQGRAECRTGPLYHSHSSIWEEGGIGKKVAHLGAVSRFPSISTQGWPVIVVCEGLLIVSSDAAIIWASESFAWGHYDRNTLRRVSMFQVGSECNNGDVWTEAAREVVCKNFSLFNEVCVGQVPSEAVAPTFNWELTDGPGAPDDGPEGDSGGQLNGMGDSALLVPIVLLLWLTACL